MNSSILVSIVSLFYITLLLIVFKIKKTIKLKENMVYSLLVIDSFLIMVFEILSYYILKINISYESLFYNLTSKMILITYLTWIVLFFAYMVTITLNNKLNQLSKFNKTIFLTYIVAFGLIIALPLKYINVDGLHIPSGIPTYIVYMLAIISDIILVVIILKNINKIKNKRYIPLFVLFILGIITLIYQMNNPECFLISHMLVFTTFLMYFTIENPDMKLLDEMHKAKKISDNANEEKTMFLYNMTQEIRETTKNINSEADIILDSDSLEQDKDSARNIKGETSKFMNVTNDILDVSTIDSTSIKVYNNKYNIKNILKEVIGIYTPKVKKKELEFRTNIEHNIPELLYGDSIGLKKVLSLILDNSVKYTEKGYVELDVNTIMKNDICRLIITIEDSGVGIKSSSLEQIKLNDLNVSQAYKTITLMNGTMLISSNYGVGTKVKIILDQKIQLEESADLKKYQEIYDNKKILVIDDNEATYKIVEKLLKGSNIIVDYSLTGKDTLTKLKSKKKYDLILLDEELSQITGYELLKKMREIRNFKVPVILLSKDNNYEYNEEYKQAGFTDVLIKPLKKDNLHLKIEKYIK